MGLLTAAAAAVRAAPADRSGLASGVNNTARQAAGALAIAIYGAIAGSPMPPRLSPPACTPSACSAPQHSWPPRPYLAHHPQQVGLTPTQPSRIEPSSPAGPSHRDRNRHIRDHRAQQGSVGRHMAAEHEVRLAEEFMQNPHAVVKRLGADGLPVRRATLPTA